MDRSRIVLLCWMCCLTEMRADAADTSSQRHAHLVDDATLHDVVFVDVEHGWVVGNHGAILHTTDGGRNWRHQDPITTVDLHGVWFVNRNLGWAVGGKTFPYVWTSQAVILRTTDGGESWQEQLALLPAMERVNFFDVEHGVVWGRGSGGEPFGVFASDDSGRNWRPVAVGDQSAWSGGDFESQHTGTTIGPGRAARIVNGDVHPLSLGDREIRAIQFADDGLGWAVGDAGIILRSSDGGATWNPVEVLPDDLRTVVDWRSVATHGKHVWITGSPGTVVLHSPDGGESWQGRATGNHATLRKITFLDEQQGWAVGELGTMLHTSDGGETWQVQRRGGERAAVLVLCTGENQIPFETLTKLSSDGYRTAVHLFSRKGKHEDSSHYARLAEALSSVGCNSLVLSTCTDQLEEADSREQLIEQIACQLRVWRPAVLIVPGDEARFTEIVDMAAKHAADEQQLNYLAEQLALAPWQVSRVFAQLPVGSRGTHRVQANDIVPHTEMSVGEMETAVRSLLNRDFQTPPDTNEFLLKASYAGEPTASMDDLAAGLSLAPGTESRRAESSNPSATNPQVQRRIAEKRRNVANIVRFASGNPALLAQVGQLMGDLSDNSAATLLFELAAQFELTGQTQLAADTRELLARRCANDPLVEATMVWLVQFYASSETAHSQRHRASEITQTIAAESMNATVQQAAALLETETKGSVTHTFANERYIRAVQLAERIAQARPLLYTEPQLRVPAAVAQRRLSKSEPQALVSGDSDSTLTTTSPDASRPTPTRSAGAPVGARDSENRAERYLQSLSLRYPGEAWQECGAVERWLAEPDKRLPKKRRLTCRFTMDRPNLDGKLDEKCWQQDAIELKPLDPQSEIHLAHDEEYLYLGVRCARSARLAYSSENDSRTYDADLSQQDRVRILLDLDRDYTTYFALMVDHRGWTNDACWKDKTWNPKWFVAAGGDSEFWTVEAAIPWDELTSYRPKVGDAWAVGCERLMPGLGTQSLGRTDVSDLSPHRFGVLLFK